MPGLPDVNRKIQCVIPLFFVAFALVGSVLNGCDNGATTTSSGQGGSATASTGTGEGGATTQASTTGAGGAASTSTGSGSGVMDGARLYSTNPAEFGGPTRCAKLNAQLCEDFESGTLDKTTWEVGGTAPVIEQGK